MPKHREWYIGIALTTWREKRLSNEVSLGIPFHLKKKVRGGCELPGLDMQKP
jgi:hypothetical protein